MKVSTRLNGRVTSISLNDGVCIMHYLLHNSVNQKPLQDHMNDYVARRVLPEWKEPSAKGLSTKVTHMLIRDCLEEEDWNIFDALLEELA